MYQLKRFADCWAVINDETGASRRLDEKDISQLTQELPHFNPDDPKLRSLFVDHIRTLTNLPTQR